MADPALLLSDAEIGDLQSELVTLSEQPVAMYQPMRALLLLVWAAHKHRQRRRAPGS